MAGIVFVWAADDLDLQHHAAPPADDTTQEWDGVTACGISAVLRWVPGETVDRGRLCERCIAVGGVAPALDGDHPGPV